MMNTCSACPHAETLRLALIAAFRYHNDVRHDGMDPRDAIAHLAFMGVDAPRERPAVTASMVDAAIALLEDGQDHWTVAETLGVSPSKLLSALARRRRQMDAGDFRARHSPDNRRQ